MAELSLLIMVIIATIGLTNILVHGQVLDEIKISGKSVRDWMHSTDFTKKLFTCYECTGFWAGLVVGLICYKLEWWWAIIIAGFMGAVVAPLYNDFLMWLHSKIDFEIPDDESSD